MRSSFLWHFCHYFVLFVCHLTKWDSLFASIVLYYKNDHELTFFHFLISFMYMLIFHIQRANPNIAPRRNRARGSNIRNLKNLGCADAKAGG